MEITRKNFLKLGMFSGFGFALPDWAAKWALKPREDLPPPDWEETVSHTVCGLCPSGCGMRVRKVDGRAVGVAGIAEHPVNRGSLCSKGAAALQELYHPDRVKGPLLRDGARGSGKWKKIAWPEALALLSKKLGRAAPGGGRMPFAALTSARAWDIQGETLRGLAGSLGKDNLFALGFPLSEPPADAYEEMHGLRRLGLDLTRAKLVVSFGFDWLQSAGAPVGAQRTFARLRSAPGRERARLIQVEPRLSATAGKADQWLRVRPGTEGLLALALAGRLIAGGTYDKAFVNSRCRGFEEFKKGLERYSPEEVAEATGAPAKEILKLADLLAAGRPAAAITNRGPLLTQLAVHALNALLGGLSEGGAFSAIADQDGFWAGPSAAAALAARPPGALLVDRVNPLFLSPLEWKGILERTPFIATVSPFLTETAEFSDLVLPCHTPLERGHCSIHVSPDGSAVLNAAVKAVEPFYDTRDPAEIFLLAAGASGRTSVPADLDSFFTGHIARLQAEKLLEEGGKGKSWREINGPAAAGPRFASGSGKFEFQALTALLVRRDAAKRPENGEFPLYVHFYSPLAFSFGEGAHLPYLQSVAGPGMQDAWETWAELHPETAGARGIADGDAVWIASQRGKIKARARLSASAMPAVVSLPVGLGHTAYGRWAARAGSNPLELGSGESRVKIWKS
ncbi:MAG: molybdopterin-dependent oxidoreductase [Elusimicrobia bacterium]|nr:molybdopterin-dependent oxidoreductase [Elusimicrobiota bacterium]